MDAVACHCGVVCVTMTRRMLFVFEFWEFRCHSCSCVWALWT